MGPALTLRHYVEAPLAHSHDHAQLVFGLSGHLDLEVNGRGSQVRESSVMVLPFSAHHACCSRDGSRCLVQVGHLHLVDPKMKPVLSGNR